jgi:predicted regulator of Ras-like GTPase activity (Roadblock/LC7/MglB family)
MSVFDAALEQVVTRVPEIRFVTLTDTDGIEVARKSVRTDQAAQSLSAEYTTVLRTVVGMAREHGLGALRELQIGTEKTTALLVAVTAEYYLVALLEPDSITGRARFHLRIAGLELEREFA